MVGRFVVLGAEEEKGAMFFCIARVRVSFSIGFLKLSWNFLASPTEVAQNRYPTFLSFIFLSKVFERFVWKHFHFFFLFLPWRWFRSHWGAKLEVILVIGPSCSEGWLLGELLQTIENPNWGCGMRCILASRLWIETQMFVFVWQKKESKRKKKKDWERCLLLLKLEGDIEFERYARRNYSGALSCMFFNILTFPFQKEVGSWGTTKISKCYILNKIYVFLFSPLALVERSSSVGMGHCGW